MGFIQTPWKAVAPHQSKVDGVEVAVDETTEDKCVYDLLALLAGDNKVGIDFRQRKDVKGDDVVSADQFSLCECIHEKAHAIFDGGRVKADGLACRGVVDCHTMNPRGAIQKAVCLNVKDEHDVTLS